MTSGWDAFSTRRLWPLATLSTVQNMGGKKNDVVFWSEHVLFLHLNTILFFMLFFQGLVVINGIRYAFLRPTRFPLQIPKCRAPLKQHKASALPTIHRCQVVHPFAWQIQRYPANKSPIFSYVVYSLSLSSSFTHVHPVSSSLIIPYHELSPIFVHLLLYDQMIPNDGTCKSIQIRPSKCHSPGSAVAEICQRHSICIVTSLRLGIRPGTAPENMLPLDPERTRETQLWSW